MASTRWTALGASAIVGTLVHCASGGSSPTPESNLDAGRGGLSSSGSPSGSGGGSSGQQSSGLTSSSDGSSGAGSSSGTTSSSGAPAVDGGCAASDTTQTSFVDLAVKPGAPLSPGENDPIPSAANDAGPASPQTPQGWQFYLIDGAMCRDGSPAGIFVHYGTAEKLFIYLEGGGACSSATFCSHNPAAIDSAFSGGAQSQGRSIGESIGALNLATQVPYVPTAASGLTAAYSPGIFDFTNAANPVKDWSGVYVPYCTGDVHFGTADNVTIPAQGLLPALTNQHFVGYRNMQKFIARIVPTFPNVTQVLLTGASAGGFGAGLDYGMVQDSFRSIPVTVLDDSGPPFRAQFLPPCVQKTWRTLWGFDAALPSDCKECFNTDGSGLTDIVLYWHHKYKNAQVGLVSTVQDEVMRLFFASGDMNCASNDATSLDLGVAAGTDYTGMEYTQGLDDLVTRYQCTGAFAAYYIGGMNPNFMNATYHQHIFRSEFYTADTNSGGVTMAQWTANLLSGNLQVVGP